MIHTRILIVQLMCILIVLCGYFLGDQPDSLSVMHFDPNPACPSVFTKAVKSTPNGASLQTSVTHQDNSNRKTNFSRHITYEVILPHESGCNFNEVCTVVYSCTLPENYTYLFFEEINPPPPKIS
jgi:hypothetical protein